jgi:predicted metal-dependent phosphoesterase TrpH
VTSLRPAAVLVLGLGIIAGTLADWPSPRRVLTIGGFRVLAADFHVHSSTWSDGALTPLGLVYEAGRQGLDAIAITGHNEVVDGKVGRWFSRVVGGPTVLTGEEIIAPGHHVVAVGIDHVVDWHADVAAEADAVHRQGGVAIAAHPYSRFWPAFDQAAMARLDGSEVCHPSSYDHPDQQSDLEAFAARTPLAAIGSSDFHGFGRLGECRTYVVARDASAGAIVDAIRSHRTFVYGVGGKAYGDPALVAWADRHPELRREATEDAPATLLDWVSRLAGVVGLAGLIAVF